MISLLDKIQSAASTDSESPEKHIANALCVLCYDYSATEVDTMCKRLGMEVATRMALMDGLNSLGSDLVE